MKDDLLVGVALIVITALAFAGILVIAVLADRDLQSSVAQSTPCVKGANQ